MNYKLCIILYYFNIILIFIIFHFLSFFNDIVFQPQLIISYHNYNFYHKTYILFLFFFNLFFNKYIFRYNNNIFFIYNIIIIYQDNHFNIFNILDYPFLINQKNLNCQNNNYWYY